MEINLHSMEVMTLIVHLRDWLEENSDYQNSDNFEDRGIYKTLESVLKKIESKI